MNLDRLLVVHELENGTVTFCKSDKTDGLIVKIVGMSLNSNVNHFA